MSLPQTDEHICETCAVVFPACGRKRRQKEGVCLDWKPKSSVGVNP
jgi:hypothetical protein